MLGASGAEPEYFDLLHHAGIDRFEQLRSVNPSTLHRQLAEVNDEYHLVEEVPPEATIEEWISLAAQLSGELPRTAGQGVAEAEHEQGAGAAEQQAQDATEQATGASDESPGRGYVVDPDWYEAGGPKKDDW